MVPHPCDKAGRQAAPLSAEMDGLLEALNGVDSHLAAVLAQASAQDAGAEDRSAKEHLNDAKTASQLAYAAGSLSFMLCRCLVSHDRAGVDAVPPHHPTRQALTRVQAAMGRVRAADSEAAPQPRVAQLNAAAAARILAAKGRQVRPGADGGDDSSSDSDGDSDSGRESQSASGKATSRRGKKGPGARDPAGRRGDKGVGRDEDRLVARLHEGAIGAAASGRRQARDAVASGSRATPKPQTGHLDWRQRMREAGV